jgi:uncharacterized protein
MTPGCLERMFVFFPTRNLETDPSRIGLDYQNLSLTTEDGVRLHGWLVKHPEARCTFLAFHGNAGNIGHRLPWIELMHRVPAHVVLIDYRGYGKSAGRPREEGIYRDATAAYRWCVEHQPATPKGIVFIGESIGGAVAIDLEARFPAAGLVVQSTFTSAWDMAKTMLPIGLLQPLARIRFDSEAKLAKITCPVLLIHGDRDEIVPFRMGERLFEVAPGPKYFYRVPGAGHNDLLWVAGDEYTARLRDFVNRLP